MKVYETPWLQMNFIDLRDSIITESNPEDDNSLGMDDVLGVGGND